MFPHGNTGHFALKQPEFRKFCLYHQKQPPEVFYNKRLEILQENSQEVTNFAKFTGKHLCKSLSGYLCKSLSVIQNTTE